MKNSIYDKTNNFVSIDEIISLNQKYVPGDRLENRLTGIEAPTIKNKNDTLKGIIADKIEFQKQLLEEIEEQINDRGMLKDNITEKIDQCICYLRTKLYEAERTEIGLNRMRDTRRLGLEKEIEALELQRRDENRECWRDIAILKREHRQFNQQYRDSLGKTKIIFPADSEEL